MLTPKNGVAYKKSAMNGIFPLLPQWIGKKVILKPMRILHSSQNFWRWERVWIFDVLPKKTCEREALQVQVYIQQWSLDEQGVKFM